MELDISGRKLFLPRELLDNILSHLHDDINSITNARLTCKIFNQTLSPYMYDRYYSSPSELFTLPEGRSEYGHTWPRRPGTYRLYCPWREACPLTTWTWIEVPNLETTVSLLQLMRFIWAPMPYHETYFPTAGYTHCNDGRIATSWGRLNEEPDIMLIVHQWPDAAAWDAYRSSRHAKALFDYLESLVPGCTRSSRSERTYLPRPRPHGYKTPLLPNNCGLFEIRTVYFAASMTHEQRENFQHALDPYRRARHFLAYGKPWPHARINDGCMWWLPGLHRYEGQTAVAARFVIYHHHTEIQERRVEAANKPGKHTSTWAALSNVILGTAGAIGVQSWTCVFHTGPHVIVR